MVEAGGVGIGGRGGGVLWCGSGVVCDGVGGSGFCAGMAGVIMRGGFWIVWSTGDFGGVGISEGGGVRGEDGMSSSKITLITICG